MRIQLTFQSFLIVLCGVACFCFSSCNQKTVEKDTTEPTLGIEKVYERGPVKISLRLDKESPTIADKVSLELELVSEEDYTITAPTFEKKIGEFEIVDTSSSLPELTPEGKLRQTQSYILEPFLSGEYTIPSMRFAFQNTQTKENHEIETEPLVILVSSIATDVQNLTLHDIELPVDLPKPKKNFTFPQILIGLLIVAVIVALVFYKKMPRKERLKKQIPAHERALAALKELEEQGHPAEGEVKTYYQKLSNILRTYIEGRFGLQAPEQTTEEFLNDLKSDSSFQDQHQSLLKNFLKHCDLVKFAEHTPQEEDVQKTFDSCKSFIIETTEPTA